MAEISNTVDVLIVGSGPVGAAFARTIYEVAPGTTILMVEAGKKLTDPPGMNMRNVPGGHRYARDIDFIGDVETRSGHPMARSGTFLFDSLDPDSPAGDMPAAAFSVNVGGMGAFWGTGCKRPYGAERIPFLEDELDELLTVAERFLQATALFPSSPCNQISLGLLQDALAPLVGGYRPVQPSSSGVQVQQDGKLYWTGVDVVLGPLSKPQHTPDFELRAGTLCRELHVLGDRITGAEVVDVELGNTYTIDAGAVVVACDGVRTAQLLFASEVRPAALGRYFNEHPLAMCMVALHPELLAQARALGLENGVPRGGIGRIWVPYNDEKHLHNGTIAELGPFQLPSAADPGLAPEDAAILHWAGLGEPHEQNRVEFSMEDTDQYGLPRPRFRYTLDCFDQEILMDGLAAMRRAADTLGTIIPGREPVLLPNGSSLHYQGASRMGSIDDGTSVCDPESRVWGYRNLFVGGNCVIPTATACNPTLTSVALAVKAARGLVTR
jgi:choline dehydrogenase-like flavoprotein